MNKKAILKLILAIVTIAIITCLTTSVFAEEDDTIDLSGTINGSEATDDEDEEEIGTGTADDEDEEEDETASEDEEKNENNDNNKETIEKNESNGANKDTTIDKNMPQTGLGDGMLITILFVACGVIGVYTFIKLSKYSNI